MSFVLEKPAEGRVFRLAVAPLRNVVVRDATGTGDGSWTMEGYAAVFEQETVLYDGRWFRLREIISRGAFTNVLERVRAGEELVHFNFGHDMNTSIAATDVTGIGGLELSEDDHGLRFFARVDPADPDAVRLAAKMRRGVVRQASFAFTIASERTDEIVVTDGFEDERWRIDEVGHLYDVCACPQGAYPQTEAGVRSLAVASLGRSGLDPAAIDARTTEHAAPAKRADMESVVLLTTMYQLGQQFLEDEDMPDDSADREVMQGILDQIETLIEAEASEPNEDRSGRPSGGHGRRAGSTPAGEALIAPAEPTGEGDTAKALRLAQARAHAAAAVTLTQSRRTK